MPGFSKPAPLKAFKPGKVEPLRIRVRLKERASLIKLRGLDLRVASLGVSHQAHSLPGQNVVSARCDGRQVRLFLDGNKEMKFKRGVSLRTPAGFLNWDGKAVREELRIYAGKGKHCEVVNVLNIEKYLDGLINAEFHSSWDEDSVAAQAIAARTYALYQILSSRKAKRHYDVVNTVADQVYGGSEAEDYKASKIVRKTKGKVLTVKRGRKLLPIKAFYHSTCGGKTELPQNVWGRRAPGFKKRVKCGYCNNSPKFTWKTELTPKTVKKDFLRAAQKFGSPKGWPKDWKRVLTRGNLVAIRDLKGATGRAKAVRTLWKVPGRAVARLNVSAADFRRWVGGLKVKSTAFRIFGTGAGTFRVSGRGWGHGVGMCQWGAKTMGEKGFKTASILKHYYPDARLRTLW